MTAPRPAPPYRSADPRLPDPYGPARTPAPPRTSTLSVVALVAAFVAPVVGLVLGLVARRQVRRTGENGQGLATAAVVLGTLFSLAWTAVVVVVITAGSFSASFSTTASVPASSVQSEIVRQAGLPEGSVTCPEDLPARVGATTTCTATVDGRTTPIDATVTTVDGTDVGFHISSR